MSILKTGLVAAALCFAATIAHADSSVPVQGSPVLMKGSSAWTDARAAYASQPRMTRTWNSTWSMKADAPFSREALEEKSGH